MHRLYHIVFVLLLVFPLAANACYATGRAGRDRTNEVEPRPNGGQTVYAGTLERWSWKENLKAGKEVMDTKINQMKTADGKKSIKKLVSELLTEADTVTLISDTIKVNGYTFLLANSPYFQGDEWDFGVQPKAGEKSILEAHFIVMYNGGALIVRKEEFTVKEKNEKTNEIENKTYRKLKIDKNKLEYLQKVFK